MAQHSLRKDMTCLNCNHVVEKRYCPNCGQENKSTKESFYYLFIHTVEDLVHYDSGFWKSIKYLLFYPAKLTIEYLSGKRKSYVAPIKLYIFISFLTFFLLSLLPILKLESKEPSFKVKKENNILSNESLNNSDLSFESGYKSVAEYDSIQKSLPTDKRSGKLERWFERKLINISQNNTPSQFLDKFKKSLFQNIPKALFLFMPVFAFVLWLFHSKKKWYYFEHGIYTIHYFSMLLLSFTILTLVAWVLSWFGKNSITEIILTISIISLLFWWIFYFFRSHLRFYNESPLVSRLKASAIFILNSILILTLLLFLFVYSALNVN